MSWLVEGRDRDSQVIYRERGQYLSDMIDLIKRAIQIHGASSVLASNEDEVDC